MSMSHRYDRRLCQDSVHFDDVLVFLSPSRGCTFLIAQERKVLLPVCPNQDSEQRTANLRLRARACPLHQTPYMYMSIITSIEMVDVE